jgi:hypothetical protein
MGLAEQRSCSKEINSEIQNVHKPKKDKYVGTTTQKTCFSTNSMIDPAVKFSLKIPSAALNFRKRLIIFDLWPGLVSTLSKDPLFDDFDMNWSRRWWRICCVIHGKDMRRDTTGRLPFSGWWQRGECGALGVGDTLDVIGLRCSKAVVETLRVQVNKGRVPDGQLGLGRHLPQDPGSVGDVESVETTIAVAPNKQERRKRSTVL